MEKIVNIYTVYEISKNYNISSYPTLESCLFGAVALTKNVGIDRNRYFGYGIGFDRHRLFWHPSGGTGKNVIIFGVEISSSAKIDNRKKDISTIGTGPTRGLEHILSAEKMYSINFKENNKIFCLSLHYSGANIYLFANGTEIIKFKGKDSEIIATPFSIMSRKHFERLYSRL